MAVGFEMDTGMNKEKEEIKHLFNEFDSKK